MVARAPARKPAVHSPRAADNVCHPRVRVLAVVVGARRLYVVVLACVEINQCVRCTDNSSQGRFSTMTRPCWLGRAGIAPSIASMVEDDATIQHERAVKF